jgi:hypothetical protein
MGPAVVLWLPFTYEIGTRDQINMTHRLQKEKGSTAYLLKKYMPACDARTTLISLANELYYKACRAAVFLDAKHGSNHHYYNYNISHSILLIKGPMRVFFAWSFF